MSDADALRAAALPLRGDRRDYDPLLERIGGARLVLLGEPSHGAQEVHHERALLTKRLVREKGFVAVAVDADWPDAYRVNRFVRDTGVDRRADDALGGFRRFPEFRWRNAEVLDFVAWLRTHNDAAPWSDARVGFYGLDPFGLRASMEAAVAAIDRADPAAGTRARQRFAAVERLDAQAAALDGGGLDLPLAIEDGVVAELIDLRRLAAEFEDGTPLVDDEAFHVEQAGRVAREADAHYRALLRAVADVWSLRGGAMADTLTALAEHLARRDPGARLVAWVHNAHLSGDFGRAVRARWAGDCVAVGFTTFRGSVTAAADWGGPALRFPLQAAVAESHEALLHGSGVARLQLDLGRAPALAEPRPQRVIGAIYRPADERASHYLEAPLATALDWLVHLDVTAAVTPLDQTPEWLIGERTERGRRAVK